MIFTIIFKHIWGEKISIKNTTLIILFSLAFIFLIGSVCAADVNETSLEESSIYEVNDTLGAVSADEVNDTLGVASTDESSKTLEDASFSEVSKFSFIYGNTFVVYLSDGKGNPISGKPVYYKVDGKITNVTTDDNGAAKLRLNLTDGIHKIYFTFNETGYKPVTGYKKILFGSKYFTTIKGSNMKTFAGIKKYYNVILKSNGVPLSKCKVIFSINGQAYVTKTDSNGVATLKIYLNYGKYKISFKFKGKNQFDFVRSKAVITVYLLKNPYGTKYRTVIIDADGGFKKSFLNDIAHRLRKAGWNVIVKGIGPDQHSINYKLAKNCVYMPFYNGLCAATIEEMTYDYYGGVIKSNNAVLTPSWYTNEWVSEKMSKFRNDITNFGYLKRAWDDNFSPSSFKGLNNPAQFMTSHGIRYTIGDSSYKIVEQFLYGGWVAHQKVLSKV